MSEEDDKRKPPVPSIMRPDSEKRRKSNRRLPKKHEKKVAGALGRRQPGSGAFDNAKGDARRDAPSYEDFPLLVECKRTSDKSIRLESKWLAKITREAIQDNRHPALAIQFDDEVMRHHKTPAETDWVAIPLSTLRAMFEALGQKPPV